MFKNCKFEKLKLNKSETKIQEVKFKSNGERITRKCAGLFWFEQKLISKVNWLSKYFLTSYSSSNCKRIILYCYIVVYCKRKKKFFLNFYLPIYIEWRLGASIFFQNAFYIILISTQL